MTSDARVVELIKGYFESEWPRICPDATLATTGPPAPRDEVFVHLDVEAPERWVHLRCWVPAAFQVTATIILHSAARAILEGAVLPSDDGAISFGDGVRYDIGRDGARRQWWMSVIAFPFAVGPRRA